MCFQNLPPKFGQNPLFLLGNMIRVLSLFMANLQEELNSRGLEASIQIELSGISSMTFYHYVNCSSFNLH